MHAPSTQPTGGGGSTPRSLPPAAFPRSSGTCYSPRWRSTAGSAGTPRTTCTESADKAVQPRAPAANAPAAPSPQAPAAALAPSTRWPKCGAALHPLMNGDGQGAQIAQIRRARNLHRKTTQMLGSAYEFVEAQSGSQVAMGQSARFGQGSVAAVISARIHTHTARRGRTAASPRRTPEAADLKSSTE